MDRQKLLLIKGTGKIAKFSSVRHRIDKSVDCLPNGQLVSEITSVYLILVFKMGRSQPLFVYFRLFKKLWQQINVKKCPPMLGCTTHSTIFSPNVFYFHFSVSLFCLLISEGFSRANPSLATIEFRWKTKVNKNVKIDVS